jgi:uncharacterized membrane protein YedE/YeeE
VNRALTRLLAALSAGVLFGAGLALSGMTKPSKVANFLDLAGPWDPSLGFVMAGAIAVYFIALLLLRHRQAPLLAPRFVLPKRTQIDAPLVVGAAVFGVGWGLGGFCPGPGLVAAGSGSRSALIFVVGMTLGVLIQHAMARMRLERSLEASASGSNPSAESIST